MFRRNRTFRTSAAHPSPPKEASPKGDSLDAHQPYVYFRLKREVVWVACLALISNVGFLLHYWFVACRADTGNNGYAFSIKLPSNHHNDNSNMNTNSNCPYANSCPRDMLSFANWFSSNRLSEARKETSKQFSIGHTDTQTKHFTHVPTEYRHTFYFDGKKISHPVARALRSRGWKQVDDYTQAHLIYTYSNRAWMGPELKAWQRFNLVPGYEKWNAKAEFAFYYKVYELMKVTPPSIYVPQTFLLASSKDEIEAFRKELHDRNGKHHPWVHKLSNVNQGKGITILPPDSKELLALPDRSLQELDYVKQQKQDFDDRDHDRSSIVQKYVCNEMTIGQRKFDVRMYWLVASLDPLLVLYHDGYVRIGNAAYDETSFADTTKHLTTHTGLGAESKATFAQFEQELNEHHRKNRSGKTIRFPRGVTTPVEHVRNQFKAALAEMIQIMREESFQPPAVYLNDPNPPLTTENSFGFYCADFILDNDLDVWFIEPQNGCGLDEDYYFRLEMHASLFNGMADILQEVGEKQEQGTPLLPLLKSGNWEILLAGDNSYTYKGYTRNSAKEGCKVASASVTTAKAANANDDGSEAKMRLVT